VSGAILDYVTGLGRVTVGPSEGITLYNGGTAGRVPLTTFTAAGNVGIGTSSPSEKLTVNTASGNCKLFTSSGSNSVYMGWDGTDAIGEVATNGAWRVRTGSGFTERMRIDATGNVGIGTASPTQKLDVSGEQIRLFSSSGNGVRISLVSSSTNGRTWQIGSNFITGNGELGFYDATAGAERMRLTSGGSLCLGTTDVRVNGLNIATSSAGQISFRHNSQAANRFWFMGVESGSDVFIVYPNAAGGVYMTYGATSWTGNSDERLKTNLKPIENASEKVSSLRAVTGRFKTDEENVSRSFLIAQDIQKVLPEAVDVRDDEIGTLGVRYTDVIPLLVAAIKELNAKVDAQAAEIAALKGVA